MPTVVSGKMENVLGSNTSFNGILKSSANLRIDCVYQGHIETTGNVIIGPAAKVLADIKAKAVQVWGAVRGNITSQGCLEILPTGRVWGDIQVLSLSIDEGGMFRGRCTILGQNLEPLTLLSSASEAGSSTTAETPRLQAEPSAAPEQVGR